MVEGARLESVYMGNCIKSSNLLLSAKIIEFLFETCYHSGFYFIPNSRGPIRDQFYIFTFLYLLVLLLAYCFLHLFATLHKRYW